MCSTSRCRSEPLAAPAVEDTRDPHPLSAKKRREEQRRMVKAGQVNTQGSVSVVRPDLGRVSVVVHPKHELQRQPQQRGRVSHEPEEVRLGWGWAMLVECVPVR
jgi:hypothetical protein